MERLRRGLAKLRTTRTAIGPNTPRTPDVALPAPDLAPIVAGLEALNGALTKENTNLKTQVVTITLARDSYRAALGDCQRETACLRLAHDAQVAALKSERWKGRLEGLAVGFGAGYIGGRLH